MPAHGHDSRVSDDRYAYHRRNCAALLALPLAPAAAQDTQTYPNRPVRIIVPFPAGGPTDILTRIVAQKLSERLGPAGRGREPPRRRHRDRRRAGGEGRA